MLTRWQFWVTTVVAVLSALLAGYSMTLFGQNRDTQAELTTRASFVQQTVQLQPLYRDLVKGLADLSVRSQDKALNDLLSSQGITVAPSATAPTAPAADSKKASKP